MFRRPSPLPYLLAFLMLVASAKLLLDIVDDHALRRGDDASEAGVEGATKPAPEVPEAAPDGPADEAAEDTADGAADEAPDADAPAPEPDDGAAEAAEAAEAPSPTVEVVSHRPGLLDLDGDRVPEVLVTVASSTLGRWRLIAQPIDGREPLWGLDLRAQGDAQVIYDPDDGLILVRDGAVLSGHALRTGAPRWMRSSMEPIARVHRRGARLHVISVGGDVEVVDPATGGSVAARARRLDPAQDLVFDRAEASWLRDPELVRRHWSPPSPSLGHLPFEAIFCPDGRDPALPSGSRRVPCPSSWTYARMTFDRAPTLLGFATRGEVLEWSLTLARRGDDRRLGEPGLAVAFAEDHAHAAWYIDGDDHVDLARLSVLTGEVLWWTSIPAAPSRELELTVDAGLAALRIDGRFEVFDAASGAGLLCIACDG